MSRSTRKGKHIGRPEVDDCPGFRQRFALVCRELEAGAMSKRKAPHRLGFATLQQLAEVCLGRSKRTRF